MKPKTFPELFKQAEGHEDYWVAGAILGLSEAVAAKLGRSGISRTELAKRLGTTPAYVTKILRGSTNFTLATMVRLARALGVELSVKLGSSAGNIVLYPALGPKAAGATKRSAA
jgi:transcriptional regulator with XRE-family HTH domain